MHSLRNILYKSSIHSRHLNFKYISDREGTPSPQDTLFFFSSFVPCFPFLKKKKEDIFRLYIISVVLGTLSCRPYFWKPVRLCGTYLPKNTISVPPLSQHPLYPLLDQLVELLILKYKSPVYYTYVKFTTELGCKIFLNVLIHIWNSLPVWDHM